MPRALINNTPNVKFRVPDADTYRVDDSHPLSKDLVACFSFTKRTGLKTFDMTKYRNYVEWSSTAIWSASPLGYVCPSWTALGNQYGLLKNADGTNFTKDNDSQNLTIAALWSLRPDIPAAGGCILITRDDISSNRYWGLSYSANSNGCGVYNYVVSFFLPSTSAPTFRMPMSTYNGLPLATMVQKPNFQVGTHTSGTSKVLLNGVNVTAQIIRDSCSTTSSTTTRPTGTGSTIRIGNYHGSTSGRDLNAYLYGLWIWNRQLSDAEVASMNLNPWQNLISTKKNYALSTLIQSEEGGPFIPALATSVLEMEKLSLRKLALNKLALDLL